MLKYQDPILNQINAVSIYLFKMLTNTAKHHI